MTDAALTLLCEKLTTPLQFELYLTRNAYNVKLLTDILTAKPKEILSFLNGQLPPDRTQELHDQLLAAGVLL